MKRGKRQVVQKPIVFDAEDPVPPNQQLLSHFSINHQDNRTTNQSSIIHHGNIEHRQEQKRQEANKNMPQQVQQPVVHRNISVKSQQNASNEDQKKKRLQLLRQKYLKKKQQNQPQIKQPPVESIKKESEKQKQEIEIVRETQKTQIKRQNVIRNIEKSKIQQPNNFFDSFAKSSSQSTQKQEHTSSRLNNNYLQNQMPISKPTQSISKNHNQIKSSVAPPPSESKRNKRQPPKPVMPVLVKSTIEPTTPQFNTSFEQENSQQNRKQIQSQIQDGNQKISQFNQSKLEPKNPVRKEVPMPVQKKSSNYEKKSNNNERKQKQVGDESSQTLFQALQNWLTSNLSVKSNQVNQDTIEMIAYQISQNRGEYFCAIVKNFMIFNRSVYTEEQSKCVFDDLAKNSNTSEFVKIFFTIKCGDLALHKNNIDISSELLEQLIKLKPCLLETEQNNFINFFLQKTRNPTEQILTKLFEFSPSSAHIQEHISSFHFQNPLYIARLLKLIKSYLNESLCPLYFKLINSILQHVSDEAILEKILKLVNNVSYNSAYQMKKDIKLKIIQKIDRTSQNHSTQQPQIQRQQHKPIQHNRQDKQSEKEKGLGVGNLFGYVNQAIKIITSQIPQKITNQPPSAVQQQPQQSIIWDPVLGRYLINGKVPENQTGSVFDSTNVEKEVKKKAPPPPPRALKSNQSSKPQSNQKKQQVEPLQQVRCGQNDFNKQSQQRKQIEELERKQQNQERNRNSKVPPPPSRMGIKGVVNKKPKVSARYT